MSDLNQCNFIGRLGKDPEVKYFPSGDAFCHFSIAVGETWKDKNSGEKKERTEWVSLVATGKLAEIIGQYLKKGSKVFVSGKMTTRKWEKDGQDRYTTEVRVTQMQMLDGKPSDGAAPSERPAAAAPKQSDAGGSDGFSDDDIPFAPMHHRRAVRWG